MHPVMLFSIPKKDCTFAIEQLSMKKSGISDFFIDKNKKTRYGTQNHQATGRMERE
jgi:hypothetical protein